MSAEALRVLAERWADARAAERANFQSYLIELCDALDVARPAPAGGGYQFELTIKVVTKDGVEVSNYIDCYRRDYFAIEAKDDGPGRSSDLLLRRAFGQVRNYVTYAPGGMPPFVMVMDVARTLIVWDRWDGNYGDWQAGRRIDLTVLHERPDDAAFLRAIWTDPSSLDPRARAQTVTKEVAGHLANLARALEDQGYGQERVARFIMRCVFTMFAEDIGLLPDEPFRQVLERCTDDPTAFPEQADALWKAMDAGEKFVFKKLLRFNGHFFRDSEALPLTKQAILILLLAAAADWQDVEPAILGTLLTRALDPAERHRLGAEFTPREFVERVVRPSVEDPLRERWRAEQAVVLQLREAGKKKDAEKRLREFHDWMKKLKFLDPACGSGNFLYVTMHLVKRVELEVLREMEEVTGRHELLFAEVHPKQFYGIEIKRWAREVAELVLWIGYHQFWRAHHAHRPQEPILEDTGTIECRDSVLAWDEIRHDPTRDRADPTPRIPSAVTGALVPDPSARIEYLEYVSPRRAEWPRADFIVGNPPYLGLSRQREVLGDGYVDALRSQYPDVPDTADYVMFWWYRAAVEVASGRTISAGLITTNTIVQGQNRAVIAHAESLGAAVVWAISDHPWVEETGEAAVRVAITVIAKAPQEATLLTVNSRGEPVASVTVPRLNHDLSARADVASASTTSLRANEGLSTPGFKLHGAGFILSPEEAQRVLHAGASNDEVVRPYRHGRDLTDRPRGVSLIDFGLMTEVEARRYALPFDIVRDRVKPERDANRREVRRRFWWRFGEPNPGFREKTDSLRRFIATPETAKHRFFVFLDKSIAPDNMLVCVAVEDSWVLGVLSSSLHVSWALAVGGRLGVGNDPRYNKTRCFDPFPFPDPPPGLRAHIGDLAEQIDAHRKAAIERQDIVTITGMYNVVEKLKSGVALTPREREVHEIAACGVLKDLHDELNALVAEAYGWPWPLEQDPILQHLVALHAERLDEEKAGRVRWLRPDYQIPRFGKDVPIAAPGLGLTDGAKAVAKKVKRPPWPTDVISQFGAVKRLLAAEVLTADEVASRFTGARTDIVRRHLDILLVMGEVQQNPDGRYQGTA